MNQPPSGFCGACGTPLPASGAFCPGCGAARPARPQGPLQQSPLQQSPVQQGPVQQGQPSGPWDQQPQWQGQPAAPVRGRRSARLIGVGLAVVLVAGGGLAVAVKLLGGEESRVVTSGGEAPLAGPVRSEPEEAWSWRGAGNIYHAVAAGESMVLNVSDDDSGYVEVVSLDAAGEEEWSTTLSDGGGIMSVLPGRDDILLAPAFESEGVAGISAKDGEELWRLADAAFVGGTEQGVLVARDDELILLDGESGDEKWSLDVWSGDGWADEGFTPPALSDDAAYLLTDDELVKVSLAEGEQVWSVRVERGADVYPMVAANDEIVGVGGEEVEAFDVESGEEVWSEGGGSYGAEVGVYSRTELYVAPRDYSEEPEEPTMAVFDREGEVGAVDLRADEGDVFYGRAVESGGASYILDEGLGVLYGEEREPLETYAGSVTLVDGGLYTLDDEDLSFFEYGLGRAEWTIEVDTIGADSWGTVVPMDGRVVVYADDEVISYE